MRQVLFTFLVLLAPFFAGAATTITGPSSICVGDTATLIGSPSGGTWTSGSTSIASIGMYTGIVYGVSPGTVTIMYRPPASSTSTPASFTMTVGSASTATISGPTAVCVGSTIRLAASITGGSWSSGSTSIATVDASGNVTGLAVGTSIISYALTVSCGTSISTYSITVSSGSTTVPPISGASSVCVSGSTLFTDATSGGVWTSSASTVASVSASGSVYGVSVGSATITYTITTGCGTGYATKVINVVSSAIAGTITGPSTVCVASTITLVDSGGMSGGTWSLGSSSIATVTGTGMVVGIAAGTVVVTYTVTSSGCGTATATRTITVEAPLTPPAPIAGAHATHVSSSISLTDVTPGGTWSSSAPGVATVSTTGTVTGVSLGSAIITYQLSNSCGSVNDTNLVVVTVATEVASVSNTFAASVYPNPSKGIFNIRFSTALASQGAVAVRDLTGRIIYTSKVVAGAANTTIDLNDVANGLYFLEVITFDGRSQHKVVVER